MLDPIRAVLGAPHCPWCCDDPTNVLNRIDTWFWNHAPMWLFRLDSKLTDVWSFGAWWHHRFHERPSN